MKSVTELIELGKGIPIGRKITSLKELTLCERMRLKGLIQILKTEGRIPRETSFWEMRYLVKKQREWQRRLRRKEAIDATIKWKLQRVREKGSN
jgi:adenylate cyclase